MMSSSSSSNPYLENIADFRAYSLDADLVELYFNRGVRYEVVDLDASSSSSSSGPSEFLLVLRVGMRSGGAVPSGLDVYLFDEEVGGEPSAGLFSAYWTDAGLLAVRLVGGSADGSSAFSFRLNVEGSSIRPARLKFQFAAGGVRSASLLLSSGVQGEHGRLSEAYKGYLLGWIADFWEAWDLDPSGPTAELTPPFPESFEPFDPFAHARWKVLSGGVSALSGYSTEVEFLPGNRGLLEGLNPLGVSRSTWSCMNLLYDFQGYAGQRGLTNIEWVLGLDFRKRRNYKNPDYSFDCRSFSMWGASYLRAQLAGVCPDAVVKVIGVGSHFLNYVDLGGSSPCCTGKFMWEPQNGSTYYDPRDACDNFETYGKPLTVYEPSKENSDGDFGEPNWENDPAQLERMSTVICACLDLAAGGREAELKGVCDSGGMNQWLVDNLSFTLDDGDPSHGVKLPGISPPQEVECKSCVFDWTGSWDCNSGGSWKVSSDVSAKSVPEASAPEVPFEWSQKEGDQCGITCRLVLPPKSDKSALSGSVFLKDAPSTMCRSDACCDSLLYEMAFVYDSSGEVVDIAPAMREPPPVPDTRPEGCCDKIKSLRFDDQYPAFGKSPWG